MKLAVTAEGAAPKLLSFLADALNACERAGIPVSLDHGIVVTGYGYVLPLGEPRLGNRWQARAKIDGGYPAEDDSSDDED